MIAIGSLALVALAVAATVQQEKQEKTRKAAADKHFDEVWGNILKPPPNVTSPPSIATVPAGQEALQGQQRFGTYFVVFGLSGGDSQATVEATLKASGYSSLSCRYDPEDLTDKCDTASGDYRFSLTFFHGRLEESTLDFPKSEWEQQVRFFQQGLGKPHDAESVNGQEIMSWWSEQAMACLPPNEGKRCPVESLMVVNDNERAGAQAMYTYQPLYFDRLREMTQQAFRGKSLK